MGMGARGKGRGDGGRLIDREGGVIAGRAFPRETSHQIQMELNWDIELVLHPAPIFIDHRVGFRSIHSHTKTIMNHHFISFFLSLSNLSLSLSQILI
jgi:hypothetical protein